MNIFVLERNEDGTIDWVGSAKSQDNYRVVKMPLECAQMACTNLNELAGQQVMSYRSVHKNHPSTVWARKYPLHFLYLIKHGIALCDEYTERFGKEHKCRKVLLDSFSFYLHNRSTFWFSKDNNKFEQPPLCMPNEYKNEDVVESYRRYYASKPRIRYPKNKIPSWFKKYRGNIPYEVIE